MLSHLLWDLRLALRSLRRSPVFSLVVVLCLAVGIGANSAIFSVVDAVLVRPLPYPEAGRLVFLSEIYRGEGEDEAYPVSPPDFVAWRQQRGVFSAMAAIDHRSYTLGGDEPERIAGAKVSADLFGLLGTSPALGRTFSPEEDRPGGPDVALLSDRLWRRHFGADPRVEGGSILLNGEPYTVVGVLPPGFDFPSGSEVWVPLALADSGLPAWRFLDVVARLEDGTTRRQAQAAMETIAGRLAAELPETNAGWGVQVTGLQEALAGDAGPLLWMLLAAVGLVLAIACANVANLFLVRAAEQERELAVRAALGGSRRDLVRQLLTQGLLLALVGGLLGLLLAFTALGPITALSPVSLPGADEIHLDLRLLAFTLALSLLTGLLFSLAPAWRASRPRLSDVLVERSSAGGGGSWGRRLRKGLVVAEVALAVVLLTGAALMIQSFWRLSRVPAGFAPEGVLTGRISLPWSTYGDEHLRRAFFDRLRERLGALPGVEAVGLSTTLPMEEPNISTLFTVEDRPLADPADTPMANSRMVSPGYFRTLGIPLRQGRDISSFDGPDAPQVAVVNQTFAERYWPGRNPLERRIRRGGPEAEGPWITVVGVVGDVREIGLDAPSGATFYLPYGQNSWPSVSVALRTAQEPGSLLPALRRVVREIDSQVPVYQVLTLEERVRTSMARPRFTAVLLLLFAAVALAMAVLGIYAVVAYTVRQRDHEFGVRLAMGAEPRGIMALVLRQTLSLVAAGAGLGLLACWFSTRLLRSLLHGVSATDPLTLVAVPVVLLVVGLLGGLMPSWRATRADPAVTLRGE